MSSSRPTRGGTVAITEASRSTVSRTLVRRALISTVTSRTVETSSPSARICCSPFSRCSVRISSRRSLSRF
ncbi:hypothetical protein [Streptosporangium sp. NPDC006007]|uniref:hypothetical protein n=1 Tax=Streptosporangium sp. NPDC006007 TaxID=3154575 RepID=UPI0033B2327F